MQDYPEKTRRPSGRGACPQIRKGCSRKARGRRRKSSGDSPYHHGDLHEALLKAAECVLERDGLAG